MLIPRGFHERVTSSFHMRTDTVNDIDAPLILLPGMGADARMFAPLRSALPQLVTPAWIEPKRGESLVSYARRLAKDVDPGRACYVGGTSFGGVVALEVAAALPSVRACFLIGSMRSPDGLPWRLKALRPLTPLMGVLPLVSWLIPPLVGAAFGRRAQGIAQQLADADAKFMRWAATAILAWKPSPEVAHVRVFQVHGGRDRVLPARLATADCLVKEAGHILSVTHSTETAEFLLARMTDAQSNHPDAQVRTSP